MEYYIGTSGWQYASWRGKFYPREVPKAKWLNYYANRFNTVEINSTFYRLPSDAAVSRWYQGTPADFTISLKASRYITHIKRLRGIEEPLAEFLKRASILKEKLGAILFQLPPNLQRDDERLAGFLSVLPGKYKYVVEFRHRSWFDAEVWNILHKYGVAFCVLDMPGLSAPVLATASFTYVRFHGSVLLYGSRYTRASLSEWAKRIKQLDAVSAAYIYFNNDFNGFAIENARMMQQELL